MAFTMHSHSGEFCPGHAADTLEAIILRAIALGFQTIGLTEHMPRTHVEDLYPEEITPTTPPSTALTLLPPRHTLYLSTALSLRAKYSSRIQILIAFESECPRPSYLPYILSLASDPAVDYFVASLHHVRSIPIDFDAPTYAKAVEVCGGEEGLWREYLAELRELVRGTRGRVVGHLDLVRLYSASGRGVGEGGRMGEADGGSLKGWGDGGVWREVVGVLQEVKGYGGWLECNTSGLRKGLGEPYPGREVAEEWIRMGGKFTFSDDSHGVAQVGTNYLRGLDYLEGLGVKELWTFERGESVDDGEKAELREKAVSIAEFRASLRLD